MAAFTITVVIQDPLTGQQQIVRHQFDPSIALTATQMAKLLTELQAAVTSLLGAAATQPATL